MGSGCVLPTSSVEERKAFLAADRCPVAGSWGWGGGGAARGNHAKRCRGSLIPGLQVAECELRAPGVYF